MQYLRNMFCVTLRVILTWEKSKKLLMTILAKGPNAVGRVIAAVNAAGAPVEAGYKEEVRLFGECFGTPEMQEGVGAFLEKRTPKFS
jgi:enoyl-CoA hydratase